MIRMLDVCMTYYLDGGRTPNAAGKAAGGAAVSVLDHVRLDVAAGESVAIIGPSGSGKTTLLLLLAGLETPGSGHVEVGGTDLSALSADELADLRRDRVGIVFQSFHLIPSLTALNNVSLPLEMAGAPGARERARDILAQVGLADRDQHYPAQLSGGEQQRVAIARALVHQPALLLADEPTGNLDTQTGAQVGDILFELHRAKASTMVLVTHDETVARRCDRVLRLDRGRLIERRLSEVSA